MILGLSVLAESTISQPERRIPFDVARNKVILSVRINGSRPPEADGIICNNTLMRFHVVFDFSAGKLYLKPNRMHTRSFFTELAR